MDRIEQLMKDAKPPVTAPGSSEDSRSVVSSTDPNVLTLARQPSARRPGAQELPAPHRRRPGRVAAAAVLAAAAVVGAVIVGGNLLPQPAPGPAHSGAPTPVPSLGTASAAPTTPPPTTASASASSSAAPGAAPLTTGGAACIPANIDQLRNDQQRPILPIPPAEQAYYTVLGCADGWLAYTISDEGARALQLDGGNAWFRLAKLQNGRFLWDVRQPWATVLNWEFQALNNQGLTPQQAMDKEFAQKGIPASLRPQLVGDGPAAGQ